MTEKSFYKLIEILDLNNRDKEIEKEIKELIKMFEKHKRLEEVVK